MDTERSQPKYLAITNLAASIYRNASNEFPGTELNQLKFSDMCKGKQCPGDVPYSSLTKIPRRHIFADNVYLAITAPMGKRPDKKGDMWWYLPDSVRKAVVSFFAQAGDKAMNMEISRVPALPASNGRVTLLVDCKTHHQNPEILLNLLNRCKLSPLKLTDDIEILYHNADYTANCPGTVWSKTTDQLAGFRLLGLDMAPIKNKHYVGLQCHSFGGGASYKWGESTGHRHNIEDFDTGITTTGGSSRDLSAKVYSKVTMQSELTSVNGKGGNGAKNNLHSDHRDITAALRDPECQKNGIARLEVRFGPKYLPDNWTELEFAMAEAYSVIMPGNVTNIWTANDQYLNYLPEGHKTLLVAREIPGGYEWCHIRWMNRYTHNFNCESSGNVKPYYQTLLNREAVLRMAFRVQLADSPIVVLIQGADGVWSRSEFEPTGKKPDAELLPPQAHKESRAAWRQVQPGDVGTPDYFFSPCVKQPEFLESEYEAWIATSTQKAIDAPVVGTQKEYKAMQRSWLKLVQRKAQEQKDALAAITLDNASLAHPLKFSDVPAKAILVIGSGYSKFYRDAYITLANGKSYRRNGELKKPLYSHIAPTPENPYILVRGPKDSKNFNGKPCYNETKLLPLNRENVEEYFPQLAPLFWTEADYSRYKDIVF